MRYLLIVCLLVVGCDGQHPGNSVDCSRLDTEIAIVDRCAPAEGLASKWTDVRPDVCLGNMVDCGDLLEAIDFVSGECPNEVAMLLQGACN